jgi:hypothetical protein
LTTDARETVINPVAAPAPIDSAALLGPQANVLGRTVPCRRIILADAPRTALIMVGVPRVSVISVFVNAEAFLAEAIESAIAQTFQDWSYRRILVTRGQAAA